MVDVMRIIYIITIYFIEKRVSVAWAQSSYRRFVPFILITHDFLKIRSLSGIDYLEKPTHFGWLRSLALILKFYLHQWGHFRGQVSCLLETEALTICFPYVHDIVHLAVYCRWDFDIHSKMVHRQWKYSVPSLVKTPNDCLCISFIGFLGTLLLIVSLTNWT